MRLFLNGFDGKLLCPSFLECYFMCLCERCGNIFERLLTWFGGEVAGMNLAPACVVKSNWDAVSSQVWELFERIIVRELDGEAVSI